MISSEAQKTLFLVWPLLIGIFLIMAGNGLQGTLLGIRAQIAEFPPVIIGIIMSLYYCGHLAGCFIVPYMIASVGHIRVFAAMASLASTTILLHGVFIDPMIWAAVRLFSGLSFSGLFIVAESWLNKISPNRHRAQVFSAYVFIVNFGFFGGQYLLYLTPPEDIGLFIAISILVSLALVPITLANKPAPGYEAPEILPAKKLFEKSPLALAGVFASGFTSGSILGFAPVFLGEAGETPQSIANFIGFFILGCACIPLAIGWISDRVDRRKVIVLTAIMAALISGTLSLSTPFLWEMFILGGLSTSLYSISIAYMNDHLEPEHVVSASSSLILCAGVGACIGPFLSSAVYGLFGSAAFFPVLLFCYICLSFFGIWRMYAGDSVVVEEQSEFMHIPARAAPTILEMADMDSEEGTHGQKI